MARPRGAPKPQARNRRPRRPENRENLASLTSEVLRLRLQALNLPITGSKAQLVKRLQNAFQPTQRPLAELRKQAGRVRKGRDKGKPRVEQPSVPQLDPIAEDVAEVTDDSSSVSSEDDFEMPSDVDPVEQSVIPDSQAPFTAGQLAAIQRTVQQSVAEAMYSHRSQVVPDTVQPFLSSFPSESTGPQQRRSGVATPLGFQRALEKSTEDKILRGEYLDLALLLPDSLSRPQAPELQLRFDDSGSGPSSRMTMVRKRKPVIDTFHKWLDAYTTYMLVLVTAYPRRSLELLKYQQTISCAAAKFKGLSWLTYDEQFRRRAANDLTISWGQVDLELWTVTFSGLAKPHCVICSSPYHSHSDCPSADPSRQQSRTGSVCFRFNRSSGCSSSSCQFPHVCRRCHSPSHSILSCPKSNTRKDHSNQRFQSSSTGERSKR